jgi:branched-chain amino acid transport system permease protein
MELLLQQLVNGLSLGSLYAIFAIGFGLIFANMGILNVAHGSFATWGVIPAYLLLVHAHVPFWVALLVGVLGAGLIGLLAEWLAFKPLRDRGAGMLGSIIVAVGIWIILLNLAEVVLGHNPTAMPEGTFPTRPLYLGEIAIPPVFIVNWIAVAAVAVGLSLFLSRTRFGAAIRSVGFKPETAVIVGVDARLLLSVTAVLAAAIAGLAGVLTSISTNNVSFSVGEGLMLKGFAAVVIGGFGNIRGAVIAGIGLGVIEAMTLQYLSTTFRDAITFGLLLVFLVLRPQGIFGELKVSRG